MTGLLANPRRWRLLAATLLLLGITWTWASRVPTSGGSATATATAAPGPYEGAPAPDFTLATADGQSLGLTDLRGQVVILNIWASWCGPCRLEMPAIERFYQAQRQRGVEVLAVNSTFQDSEENAQNFARELGLTFPIVFDRDGAVTRRYQIHGLPTTFVLDRRGVIRSVTIGGTTAAALQSIVDPLLAEAQ